MPVKHIEHAWILSNECTVYCCCFFSVASRLDIRIAHLTMIRHDIVDDFVDDIVQCSNKWTKIDRLIERRIAIIRSSIEQQACALLQHKVYSCYVLDRSKSFLREKIKQTELEQIRKCNNNEKETHRRLTRTLTDSNWFKYFYQWTNMFRSYESKQTRR
jgi:hypothetical protein